MLTSTGIAAGQIWSGDRNKPRNYADPMTFLSPQNGSSTHFAKQLGTAKTHVGGATYKRQRVRSVLCGRQDLNRIHELGSWYYEDPYQA